MAPGCWPSTLPMPINAMPMVATLVQELPVKSDTSAVTTHAPARKNSGRSTSMP